MLRVEGERCYHVPPLDFPPHGSEQTLDTVRCYPAVQLFVERMLAGGGGSAPTEAEVPLVAEICRKLDGLPLAIALAAGQAAGLGVKNTGPVWCPGRSCGNLAAGRMWPGTGRSRRRWIGVLIC
jgi:predicted ATPase